MFKKSKYSPSIDRPELVAKLNEEITIEQEQLDEGLPADLQEYLDNCEFQLEDIPGNQEVALTRTYGDEKYVLPC